MNPFRTCTLCGTSKAVDQNVRLFSVPKNEEECNKWIVAVGKHLSINGSVCSKHFLPEHVGKLKLLKGACPIPNVSNSSPDLIISESFPDLANTDSNNVPNINKDSTIFLDLFNKIQGNRVNITLPDTWGCHKLEEFVVFSKLIISADKNIIFEHAVILTKCSIDIKNSNEIIPTPINILTIDDLEILIRDLESKTSAICGGKSLSCVKIIPQTMKMCRPCKNYNAATKFRRNRKVILAKKKRTMSKCNSKEKLEYMLCSIRNKPVNIPKIRDCLGHLPDSQKNMVKACFKAAKYKKNGLRYTVDWIYTCLLMRIKSPSLYNHMRNSNILPLPCLRTLSRYIKNIDSSFGFKPELFNIIKEKSRNMEPWQRHGCLLVDECKISETKSFNKNTMELMGFVDLGKHTPERFENTLGDHILVFMFQPFAGHGIQALGCFLTKNNICGDIQAKLVLECVLLCENAGLFIDVVTSDGATWNRTMWRILGIDNPLTPWCSHPTDPERKLRMCSDFPHLIKCLRNTLEKKEQFQIPKGRIHYKYFERLVDYEATNQFRMAYKLTARHLHPKYGDKMATRLAFQLFSKTVASALEALKHKVEGFEEVDPIISFCLRINNLIDIMNSKTPATALKYDSSDYKELEDFLLYLDLWQQCSPQQLFLSRSTFEGLRATISSTLDLTKYLFSKGYKYLMTSRINQDHLEHFFGMLRAAGGCNTHPDSIQVAQIFRLMSLHSLIKPPRGSNVSGGEMIRTLLDVGDLKNETKKNKKLIFDIHLIEGESYVSTEVEEQFNDNEEAFAYFCGYIAKKFKTIKCKDCSKTITGFGNEKYNDFIKSRSKGYLTYPSLTLIQFLKGVETCIGNSFAERLSKNCLAHIIEQLNNYSPKKLLGCEDHKAELSKDIIHQYVISRLSICCLKEQQQRTITNKSKHLAKLAKLQ